MDDLSGLDWSSSGNNTNSSQNPTSFNHPPLRATPSPSISGRSTPLNLQNPTNAARVLKVQSKPGTQASDSFASLLGAASGKTANNVSLQERQKQLQDERARQQAEQQKKLDAHFGGSNASFWNNQAQAGSTTSSLTPSPAPGAKLTPVTGPNPFSKPIGKPSVQDGEDDLLAAFNATAPVDSSSYFPPPQNFDSGRSTPAQSSLAANPSSLTSRNDTLQFNDDDDPFGLSEIKQKATPLPTQAPPASDDDDILGMLGKPVSELPKPQPKEGRASPPHREQEREEDEYTDPRDKAVAELVDMGFPADKAAKALARTEDGRNVQAAVGILLNEAHEESRQKARGQTSVSERADSRDAERRRRPVEGRSDDSLPTWARQEQSGSRQRDNQSPAPEKDLAQTASEMGASFLKGANSLWKAGQKRVQKAVADFQQDGDPSQPKWMRDAQLQQEAVKAGKITHPDITNEVAMLEAGGRQQKPPRPQKSTQPTFADELPRRPSPVDREPTLPPRPSATRMTRQDLEDQTTEFYVSPARRRGKATPPASTPPSEPPSRPATSSPLASASPFETKKPATPSPLSQPSSRPPKPPSKPTAPPTKPAAPPRQIPPVSATALQESHTHRLAGGTSFAQGDYASATTSYTCALAPLPPRHPLTIILLTNRALTHLRTGDAKSAAADAETALALVGPARGRGEAIALGAGERPRDMRDVWGRALARRAEALELLERYADALALWRVAVEEGVGGAAAAQGRARCERVVGGARPGARARPAVRPKVPARRPAAAAPGPAGEAEAVRRMREANAAAERADDEKFALTDAVDAKLVAWKGSKADNLRALLGSLDKILWPEAGYVLALPSDCIWLHESRCVWFESS